MRTDALPNRLTAQDAYPGWATHIVDISKKPDGSEWGNEIIRGIYIALYAPSQNSAIIDFDWIAIGVERSDFATNADLSREISVLKYTDIPAAVTTVASAQKYGLQAVLIEANATVNFNFLSTDRIYLFCGWQRYSLCAFWSRHWIRLGIQIICYPR